jgi:hypothetical protein
MTMGPALGKSGIGGAIFLVVVFAAFFCLSCIILIIMEGVSAMVSFFLVSSLFVPSLPSCASVRANKQNAVALAPSGVGRVLLQVCRVWRVAVHAVFV